MPDVTERTLDEAHEADEAAGQATANTVGPREQAAEQALEDANPEGFVLSDDRTAEEAAHDAAEGRFESK